MPNGKSVRHKVFRGQGTLCTGKLTITLSGQDGAGKSLVSKILKAILPFTPVDEIQIVETYEPNVDEVRRSQPARRDVAAGGW